tara:strand:- start:1961 stop:2194 length:234 start_codon:yes stop_codon:yes gene_type:complete
MTLETLQQETCLEHALGTIDQFLIILKTGFVEVAKNYLFQVKLLKLGFVKKFESQRAYLVKGQNVAHYIRGWGIEDS